MVAYTEHPARRRAVAAPRVVQLPDDIRSWCSRIPQEEQAVYPLDQSDGGDDDDPAEHAEWTTKLKRMGRNPNTPWLRQSELITIDAERDYLSDRGDEVWNVLEDRGIKNVILAGVHTNMCVLGRPFGLRQMARHGKNVVLMRDMTDTMYNPARWPYVSHFTGTDLIVSHIERFVCPTIASDQILGGEPFRFQHDQRPHLAIVVAEDEYETEQTLSAFAARHLGRRLRVSLVFGSDQQRNEIPGLEVLHGADLVLLSIRRRTLRAEQLAIFREFVAAGKPVIGIRTASHSFSLRNQPAPAGLADWPEFDAQVFGGNYTNHYGNKLKSTVRIVPAAADHPIIRGLSGDPFLQGGSLYKTSPLTAEATVLLTGEVEGQRHEPAAWTFRRADGGRSFYTSLGHPRDFENPEFIRLLLNGIHWAADLPPQNNFVLPGGPAQHQNQWNLMPVPGQWEAVSRGVLKDYEGAAWYRCALRPRDQWIAKSGLSLQVAAADQGIKAWFNGQPLEKSDQGFGIRNEWIERNDANLIVLRIPAAHAGGLQPAPLVISGDRQFALKGTWQFRLGDDPTWSNMPLPARYGASTDIIFEP